MSYSAIIGKIKTSPHPNADRLKLGVICGEQVIVGLDVEDDQLMVFFPCDGQLSMAFANANNLVAYTDPTTGEKRGGYFGKNRRVRAQKLRGEISEGFAIEKHALAKAGVTPSTIEKLKEGDCFTELDGIELCCKYVTPATRRAQSNNSKKQSKIRKNNIMFPQHFDTKQFRHAAQYIPGNSLIYLTEKLHGTSGRYAFVQEKTQIKQPWYKRIFGIKKPISKVEWAHCVGTRRVILNNPTQTAFHGDNSRFRFDFMENVWSLMKKGEIIFGEIVGFDSSGNSIMPCVSTEALKDKKFQKHYGKIMTYKYGCPEGSHKFYVYRIVMVNEDGEVFDLPWSRVKNRCGQLGLEYVPEFLRSGVFIFNSKEESLENLEKLVKKHVDGPSLLDSSHIREGVAIRIEHKRGVTILKEKSFPFKVLEGIAKDNSNYIDIEEAEDSHGDLE